MIHDRLCPPPTCPLNVNRRRRWKRGGELLEPYDSLGGSLLNHDCQWRNPRPSQPGREANRDGNSWNVVLLYFFARVSPPSLPFPPSYKRYHTFEQGGISTRGRIDEALVRSVRRFCSHNSFGSLLFPTRRDTARIHQAQSWLRLPSLLSPGYRIIHRPGCRRPRRDLKCWYHLQPFLDVLRSSIGSISKKISIKRFAPQKCAWKKRETEKNVSDAFCEMEWYRVSFEFLINGG